MTMATPMTWQTFIIKLVELLRPRFYNRITWLIVLSGLAMMSSSLWETILNEVLKKEFNISISGDNDAAWGFVLCVLGLAYHMANTGFYELVKTSEARDRKLRERQHDAAVFNQARTLLSEDQLENFLYMLDTDHSYYMDACGEVEKFVRFLAATNNQFLTPSLAARTNELISAWGELGNFISYKFFIYPSYQKDPPFRLCMTPGLNVDRDGDGTAEQMSKYYEFADELRQLSSRFSACYHAFRGEVKNELVI